LIQTAKFESELLYLISSVESGGAFRKVLDWFECAAPRLEAALEVLVVHLALAGDDGVQRAVAHRDVAAQVKLKAIFESNSSCYSFKRLIPGAFDAGLIGSSCTALP